MMDILRHLTVKVLLTCACLTFSCVAQNMEISACDARDSFRCNPEDSIHHLYCISEEKQCNGVPECANGYDESVEICGCPPGMFECGNKTCIEERRRCDLRDDCMEGEDELNCELYGCPPTHMKCANHACYPKEQHCDFHDNCGDNSDESGCDYRACYESEYQCHNKQCILAAFLCDHVPDCLDHSDETSCNGSDAAFESHVRCANGFYVAAAHRCDGWVDCKFCMTDELGCNCTEGQFVCNNTRCVEAGNVCDTVCDCGDTCEDELDCDYSFDEKFICLAVGHDSHSRLIDRKHVCDGHNNCLNNQHGHDEETCAFMDLPRREDFRSCEDLERSCPVSGSEQCVHIGWPTAICDGILDCANGLDEQNCSAADCADAEMTCRWSRECFPRSLLCDGQVHCSDMTDETDCEWKRCSEKEFRCGTGQCIPQSQQCDFIRDCLDGSDEHNCEKPERCREGEFRCSSGQCIAEEDVCFMGMRNDRPVGCGDNSHLLNCSSFKCSVGQFKCRNSYCIPHEYTCDHKPDCFDTYTDEELCPFLCPYPSEVCECYVDEMNCENKQLDYVPDTSNEKGLNKYVLKGNKIGHSISNITFIDHDHITYLDISYNDISHLGRGIFKMLWKLQTLNMAHNNLTRLSHHVFDGLYQMTALFLHGNNLSEIDSYAFKGASALLTLDLSYHNLQQIKIHAFAGLQELKKLNLSHNRIRIVDNGGFNNLRDLIQLDLSHNKIQSLGEFVFNGLSQLQNLDISNNEIGLLAENTFNGVQSLSMLVADEFWQCCMARFVDTCYPEADEFSSCEDLMSNYVLRICIWLLAVLALCGNAMVLVWRICDNRDTKVHSFLISQLAISDMLMGVYLMIIAGVDAHYRGVYIAHDHGWRTSHLCKLAGFLSTFSSELSVFTLTVITMDRFVAIAFPFHTRRLSMLQARLLMSALWLIATFMAVVPLMGLDYFTDFYGRSGVCLALHITASKPPGWEYSVAIFLVLNLISFIVIAVAYVWMFVVVSQSRSAARGPEVSDLLQARSEQAMARRMSVIVGTDFCCWVPISLLGLSSLAGANIPPQVYAWVAVFILPLNSAVNPMLYTISTATFISQAKHRMFHFRQSFRSSGHGTRSTLDSCPDDRHQMSDRRPFLRHSRSHPDPCHTDRNHHPPFKRSTTANGISANGRDRSRTLQSSLSTDCSNELLSQSTSTRTEISYLASDCS